MMAYTLSSQRETMPNIFADIKKDVIARSIPITESLGGCPSGSVDDSADGRMTGGNGKERVYGLPCRRSTHYMKDIRKVGILQAGKSHEKETKILG